MYSSLLNTLAGMYVLFILAVIIFCWYKIRKNNKKTEIIDLKPTIESTKQRIAEVDVTMLKAEQILKERRMSHDN